MNATLLDPQLLIVAILVTSAIIATVGLWFTWQLPARVTTLVDELRKACDLAQEIERRKRSEKGSDPTGLERFTPGGSGPLAQRLFELLDKQLMASPGLQGAWNRYRAELVRMPHGSGASLFSAGPAEQHFDEALIARPSLGLRWARRFPLFLLGFGLLISAGLITLALYQAHQLGANHLSALFNGVLPSFIPALIASLLSLLLALHVGEVTQRIRRQGERLGGQLDRIIPPIHRESLAAYQLMRQTEGARQMREIQQSLQNSLPEQIAERMALTLSRYREAMDESVGSWSRELEQVSRQIGNSGSQLVRNAEQSAVILRDAMTRPASELQRVVEGLDGRLARLQEALVAMSRSAEQHAAHLIVEAGGSLRHQLSEAAGEWRSNLEGATDRLANQIASLNTSMAILHKNLQQTGATIDEHHLGFRQMQESSERVARELATAGKTMTEASPLLRGSIESMQGVLSEVGELSTLMAQLGDQHSQSLHEYRTLSERNQLLVDSSHTHVEQMADKVNTLVTELQGVLQEIHGRIPSSLTAIQASQQAVQSTHAALQKTLSLVEKTDEQLRLARDLSVKGRNWRSLAAVGE